MNEFDSVSGTEREREAGNRTYQTGAKVRRSRQHQTWLVISTTEHFVSTNESKVKYRGISVGRSGRDAPLKGFRKERDLPHIE